LDYFRVCNGKGLHYINFSVLWCWNKWYLEFAVHILISSPTLLLLLLLRYVHLSTIRSLAKVAVNVYQFVIRQSCAEFQDPSLSAIESRNLRMLDLRSFLIRSPCGMKPVNNKNYSEHHCSEDHTTLYVICFLVLGIIMIEMEVRFSWCIYQRLSSYQQKRERKRKQI
jgi:hypothetical protein